MEKDKLSTEARENIGNILRVCFHISTPLQMFLNRYL